MGAPGQCRRTIIRSNSGSAAVTVDGYSMRWSLPHYQPHLRAILSSSVTLGDAWFCSSANLFKEKKRIFLAILGYYKPWATATSCNDCTSHSECSSVPGSFHWPTHEISLVNWTRKTVFGYKQTTYSHDERLFYRHINSESCSCFCSNSVPHSQSK